MMRYRIKPSRLTLPLSLLLLLQPVLFACSEAADTAVESTDAAAATTPVETDRSEISDNLPDVDYDGAEFNILCRTEWAYEFDVEEQTGDLVSDAIYDRMRMSRSVLTSISNSPRSTARGTRRIRSLPR